MEPRTIFFVGKPGCGKGTQAKLLAARTGWAVFGSGKLFRDLAQEDTAVGHKLKRENDAGNLQPHWFAMYLYLKSLFSLPEGASVIFDGFNRKVPEAELIISSLGWLGRPFTVLNIVVSDEEVHRRLAIRKNLDHRADDEVVAERIAEYYEHTAKAIELFRSVGALIDVEGNAPPENIAEDIAQALSLP